MITLTNTGSAIKFTFDGNSMYLQDGTIEVPFNSLTLVTDNSGMATFKKSATNDIFISATYDELGMTKSQLETWFKDNACSTSGGGGIPSGDVQTMIDQSISGMADNASYDSVSQEIKFYNGRNEVYSVDASDFVIDGMIDDVRIETISGVTYLVIDFNTASGKEDIQIPLTDIFDPSNYYTKAEVDAVVSGKADSSAVYTKSEVDEAISAATSGKVDTSTITTSVTSASTDSEIPSAKAVYDAIPTGSSITSGEVQTMIDESISGKVQDVQIGNVSYLAKPASTIQVTTNGSTYLSKGFVGSINNKKILTGSDGNQTNFFSLVETSAVTSAITSASTNSEVAGAKAVYDALSEISGGISSGEAQTMIDESISGKADSNTVATLSGEVSDMGEVTARALVDLQANKVDTSAITTSVTSASTDSEIPTAKAVWEAASGGGISSGEVQTMIDGSISGKADSSAVYTKSEVDAAISGKADTTAVTLAISEAVSGKQDTLVSGTNIKTINNESILGSGNITIQGGGNATVELTQAQYDALVTAGTVSADTYYIITDAQSADISQYWTSAQTTSAITEAVSGKVDTSSIVTAVTSGSTDSQVPSAKCVYDQLGGLKLQQITQADYDALVQAGTVDASTLYIITNVVS